MLLTITLHFNVLDLRRRYRYRVTNSPVSQDMSCFHVLVVLAVFL